MAGNTTAKKPAKKYYAVRKGRETGIFETWAQCQKQIMGFSGAIYKSFPTLAEAQAYMQAASGPVLDEATSLVAYVDGSYCYDNDKIGYGAVLLMQGQELRLNGEVEDRSLASMHNVAGEIKGAEAAMTYAVEHDISSLIIYHDYEGVAAWCTGAWSANLPGTQRYRDFYASMVGKLTVEFRKVKGHSGDRYNDLADELAKAAIGIHNEK